MNLLTINCINNTNNRRVILRQ